MSNTNFLEAFAGTLFRIGARAVGTMVAGPAGGLAVGLLIDSCDVAYSASQDDMVGVTVGLISIVTSGTSHITSQAGKQVAGKAVAKSAKDLGKLGGRMVKHAANKKEMIEYIRSATGLPLYRELCAKYGKKIAGERMATELLERACPSLYYQALNSFTLNTIASGGKEVNKSAGETIFELLLKAVVDRSSDGFVNQGTRASLELLKEELMPILSATAGKEECIQYISALTKGAVQYSRSDEQKGNNLEQKGNK